MSFIQERQVFKVIYRANFLRNGLLAKLKTREFLRNDVFAKFFIKFCEIESPYLGSIYSKLLVILNSHSFFDLFSMHFC